MTQCIRFPTIRYVRPAKPQINLRIRAVWSEPLIVAWVFYDCYATDWTPFGVSSLKGCCRGSSESTHVKMPHCWKSHDTAQIWYPLIYCSTYFQAHSHPIISFSFRPQHYFLLDESFFTWITPSGWSLWLFSLIIYNCPELRFGMHILHCLVSTNQYLE